MSTPPRRLEEPDSDGASKEKEEVSRAELEDARDAGRAVGARERVWSGPIFTPSRTRSSSWPTAGRRCAARPWPTTTPCPSWRCCRSRDSARGDGAWRSSWCASTGTPCAPCSGRCPPAARRCPASRSSPRSARVGRGDRLRGRAVGRCWSTSAPRPGFTTEGRAPTSPGPAPAAPSGAWSAGPRREPSSCPPGSASTTCSTPSWLAGTAAQSLDRRGRPRRRSGAARQAGQACAPTDARLAEEPAGLQAG